MTIRAALPLLLFFLLSTVARAAERASFDFVYLYRDGDPSYAQTRAYTGLRLRDRQRPIDGARVAIKESKVLGRALGLQFGLREESLAPGDDAAARIEAFVSAGVGVFLLDLPLAELAELSRAFAQRPVLFFNFRHRDDGLRGADCSPVLFHSLPSRAMLMDALAQFLVARDWREILVLVGPEPADSVEAEAFLEAAAKFGLKITDRRDFLLSNDPRQRGQNNLAILTSGVDYDVVFLADTLGEVGRYLPYQTQDPRPVIGSEGLVASAWHWTWERHGAPQLNQHFDRLAKRRMSAEDWAAWAAVRLVVEGLVRSKTADIGVLRDFLRGDGLTFDSYKGFPGSFRPWNNQLRQAILLHTHNAVVGHAPLEGFLHQHNTLDSLGVDRPQSDCRLP